MNHSIGAMSIMRCILPRDIHKAPSITLRHKSSEDYIFNSSDDFLKEPTAQARITPERIADMARSIVTHRMKFALRKHGIALCKDGIGRTSNELARNFFP
jgi:hypothetical protein